MSERAKEIVNALIEMIVDTRDNAALYEYMAAALKEAERERDERGKWSAHWHGEYVLAQAQITRVREALRLLVQNVQDYEAWQRPCHALDVAKAALAEPAAGVPEALPHHWKPGDAEECRAAIRRVAEITAPKDPYLTSDFSGGQGSDFGPPASTPGGGR